MTEITGRKVFAYEGKIMLPNEILVTHGSIKCLDESIPLTHAFRHDEVIGSASDFQRDEETGELSMSFKIIDERFTDPSIPNIWELWSPCMYLTDVVQSNVDGIQTLTHARLRMIALSPVGYAGTWED